VSPVDTSTFEFDLTPYINAQIRQVHAATDAHLKWLFKRTYVAGYQQAREGHWADNEFEDAMFEEFFDALVKELRDAGPE